MKTCDIVALGVGGQGVVTLGHLIALSAHKLDVPMSFVPSKGMAQRGGFVKVEIRLGREGVGPRIGARSADLVVSMERSEALKGIPYVRPDGRFILYDHVWEPTGVLLGEDAYPSRPSVRETLGRVAGDVLLLDPSARPSFDGRPVAANIFTLGAMFGTRALRECIDPRIVEAILVERWAKAAEANLAAFHAGLQEGRSSEESELSQFSRPKDRTKGAGLAEDADESVSLSGRGSH